MRGPVPATASRALKNVTPGSVSGACWPVNAINRSWRGWGGGPAVAAATAGEGQVGAATAIAPPSRQSHRQALEPGASANERILGDAGLSASAPGRRRLLDGNCCMMRGSPEGLIPILDHEQQVTNVDQSGGVEIGITGPGLRRRTRS